MITDDFIRNLSQKAAQFIPAAEGLRQDVEKRMYELMQSSFAKLNLVTREEFDNQLAVLERARKAIDELEAKVAALEVQANERKAQDSIGETGESEGL